MTNARPLVLILDTDSAHTQSLVQLCEAAGFRAATAETLETSAERPAVTFVSLDLQSIDPIQALATEQLQECEEIILMAGEDDPPRVRRAIAAGASYFFRKPFDTKFVRQLLEDVLADVTADTTADPGRDALTPDQFGYLRGSSQPMRKLYRLLRKVADTNTSVLVVGESGTGKELAARTLHQFSSHSEEPFVAMNCAAIPHDLFESELFGHEKGSFSGADKTHLGYFERAHGGTLFLDELTEMPVEQQVKLLRVLESGRYRRVGGETDRSSDVRIVAASNRDTKTAIEEGTLREDLYYRIAHFPVSMPPLRDRGEDIIALADYFLASLNEANDTSVVIDDSAREQLRRYSWPGNVRELKSVVERSYILADDTIDETHLGNLAEPAATDQLRISIGESVEDAERKLIFATLEANNGDKSSTAETLGISLKTLYNRLNQYSRDAS